MKLDEGKLNLMLGGSAGSEGKALCAQYVGSTNHIDITVSNASANAGHTFYWNGIKRIAKFLPVSGIVNDRSTIYLCAGAIINPTMLLEELDRFDVSHDRVCIHPRAAIITEEDIQVEQDNSSSVARIASTMSGVGAALVRKIQRKAQLARDISELQGMVKELDIQEHLDWGCTAFMEVPQGFELGINSGYDYPSCTSRDITVSSAMADAQVHPSYLGKVIACIRTYPIRVGNLVVDGVEIGNSGPFYDDAEEIAFEDIEVQPEFTTVTLRKRRIFRFSHKGYQRMLKHLRPNYVFLNFVNYMKTDELAELLEQLPEVTHVGTSPFIDGVLLNHSFFKGDR